MDLLYLNKPSLGRDDDRITVIIIMRTVWELIMSGFASPVTCLPVNVVLLYKGGKTTQKVYLQVSLS